MSAIDDARALVQDIVVPDLKALTARVDALEASIKQRFDSAEKLAESRHELALLRTESGFGLVDAKLAALLAAMEARFAASDARMKSSFDAVDAKFAAMLASTESRFAASNSRMAAGFASMDARFAAMDVRFETLTNMIDTDRRLRSLEAAQPNRPAADERHA